MRELPEWMRQALELSVTDGPDQSREFCMRVLRKHGPAKIVQRAIDIFTKNGERQLAEDFIEYRREAEAYFAGMAGMC